MLRLLVALSLTILVLPHSLHAQQRTVTGTILSGDNKTPLAGVTVRVKGTNRITQTDVNVKFGVRIKQGSLRSCLQKSFVSVSARNK